MTGHEKLLADIIALLREAELHRYHDFKGDAVTPKVDLAKRFYELQKKVKRGEYDDKADSDDLVELEKIAKQGGLSQEMREKLFGLKEPPPRMADQPEAIQEAYRAKMRAIAEVLDEVFNGTKKGFEREIGYTLLVFAFGTKGDRVNYISNAERKDMLQTMKEFIARAEGRIIGEEQLQ